MTSPPGGTPGAQPSEFLPSRRLPLLYFGFAHACLALALATLAFAPARVAGFYYQPRAFAVVHLITLGFVSGSILGALHLVAPLAFRLRLPVHKSDHAVFACFAIGTLGMASHFWIDRPLGMLWAAPLAVLGLAHVGGRVLVGLRGAPLPAAVKLHVALACANVLLAGALGFFLGLNKLHPLASVPPFAGVIAHAHLAAVGWATMMVMGAGYRLLPMFLPSAMPGGAWAWATGIVTEVGLVGFVLVALRAGVASRGFAALIAAGVLLFLAWVVWMLRHPRPAPKRLPRPDVGIAHALFGMLCLLACVGLGLFLAWAEPSQTTLQLAKVYAALGLVGFLAQMVVGILNRLLPMSAWLWSFAEGGYRELPPSQYALPALGLQRAGFLLWLSGLPLLCAGLFAESDRLVGAGALLLLLATLGNAVNGMLALRRAHTRTPPPG